MRLSIQRADCKDSYLRSHSCSHLAARLGATSAGLSATLAVVVVVLFALSRTAIASFGTNTAHLPVQV